MKVREAGQGEGGGAREREREREREKREREKELLQHSINGGWHGRIGTVGAGFLGERRIENSNSVRSGQKCFQQTNVQFFAKPGGPRFWPFRKLPGCCLFYPWRP